MKTTNEINLTDFKFWCGAKDNASELTNKQLNFVEFILKDAYPEGMSDTDLNDLFWFDFDIVLDWLDLERCDKCGEIHKSGEFCECEEGEPEQKDEDE